MRAAAAAALLCLLVACAPPPAGPGVALQPAPDLAPDMPEAYYEAAAARGEAVFAVDATRSRAVVRVYRAGALARFGHDHVIASRDLQGYVHLASGRSRADLYLPLTALEVDAPALRAEARLDTGLSARDIEATRRNMLQYVLEAGRFPYMYLSLRPISMDEDRALLAAEVTLHGQTRRLRIEVRLTPLAGRALEIRGAFPLVQTDFGITPFAALGGALRVADRVDVTFRLYATRVLPDAAAGLRAPTPPVARSW